MKKFKISTLFVAVDGMTAPIRSMKKALGSMGRRTQLLNRSWKQTAERGRALARQIRGIGVIGIGAAAGLLAVAKRTAGVGDRIQKTAEKFGIGTDALQELRGAAKLAGIEQNTFDMALQRFSRRTAEAAAGTGEAKDALAYMGLKLRDTEGNIRPVTDLLRDFSSAIVRVKDPAVRLRIAFKSFDSEGVVMLNLLGKGTKAFDGMVAAARENGVVIGGDALTSMVRFNDKLTLVTGAIGGMSGEIVGNLVPNLTAALDKMLVFIKANRAEIIDKATSAIKAAGEAVRGFGDAISFVAPTVRKLVDIMGGWKNVGIAIAGVFGLKLLASVLMFGKSLFGVAIRAVMFGGALKSIKWTAFASAALSAVKALGKISLAFLANPIVLVAAGIAGAAFLIITHWDKISGFFSAMWSEIKGVFGAGLTFVDQTVLDLTRTGEDLMTTWGEVENFIGGLWGRISQAWRSGLAGTVRSLAGKLESLESVVPKFLKNGLGIGSGSAGLRSFAASLQAPQPQAVSRLSANGNGSAGLIATRGRVDVNVRFDQAPAGMRKEVVATGDAHVSEINTGFSLVGTMY